MRILFDWKYAPDIDPLATAEVIIGMAFGANRKGSGEPPGVSNEAIARIIYSLWTSKHLPVIVQREIAEAFLRLDIPIRPNLVISEQSTEFHINSYEVLFQAWDYCKQRALREAVVVAHPAHILRCKAVAGKIGFSVKVPNISSVPYEPRSKQWWTRNRYLFFIWEFFARISWRNRGFL
jgi:hypothetical protein